MSEVNGRQIVQAELIERALAPDDVSEAMRIFREMRRDGGTSFAHLNLDELADAVNEDDEDDLPRSFSPHDGPGDDEDDDDDEDADALDLEEAEASLEEALREADDAPWTPIPTRLAKMYLKGNEDAVLELIFPRVYEENRSNMIADLTAAQSLGYISHERSANQAAKELGFDDYDYDVEQQAIAMQPAAEPGAVPGMGDQIAGKVAGFAVPGGIPKQKSGAAPSTKTGPAPGPGHAADRSGGTEPDHRRDDLSHDAQHAFRIQQRTTEALEGALAMMRETLLAMRELRHPVATLVEAVPPLAPVVLNETVHTARPMRRRVERDAEGLISAIIDEPVEEGA